MDQHPNQVLNEATAFFALNYLHQTVSDSPLNRSVRSFLNRSQISLNCEPEDFLVSRLLVLEAAQLQRQLLTSGSPNTSLRSVIRQHKHLLPLVSCGPQALLLDSYEPLLAHLLELDRGTKTYGYGKEVYRRIVDNVMAARLMFEGGTIRIAEKIFDLYRNIDEISLFEGGAGNGAATLAVLKSFAANNKPIRFLLSDLDRDTLPTAEKLFRESGFGNSHLPWLKVDLCQPRDIKQVGSLLGFDETLIMVNFIIHEVEEIADRFFHTVSTFVPHARLSITEFLLPDYIHPSVPEWFIFLHHASGQYLRSETDLLRIYSKYGYHCFDRLDHQVIEGKPLISTLFLEK